MLVGRPHRPSQQALCSDRWLEAGWELCWLEVTVAAENGWLAVVKVQRPIEASGLHSRSAGLECPSQRSQSDTARQASGNPERACGRVRQPEFPDVSRQASPTHHRRSSSAPRRRHESRTKRSASTAPVNRGPQAP